MWDCRLFYKGKEKLQDKGFWLQNESSREKSSLVLGPIHTWSWAGLYSVQVEAGESSCFTKQMGTSISGWLHLHSHWWCTGFLDLPGCPWCCHCVPPRRESLHPHYNPRLWPDGRVPLKNKYMTWLTQNSETAPTSHNCFIFNTVPHMMQLEERKIHYYIKLFLDLKKKKIFVCCSKFRMERKMPPRINR